MHAQRWNGPGHPGLDGDGTLRCGSCGRILDGDLEDDPLGNGGRPICGECNRARNFDVDLEVMDAADGQLDGMVDFDEL
jgi:hypothetical protein